MSDAQRSRLMSSVTRQARVLDSITADLLTAAEIQRGSLRLDPQAVEPIEVIDAVITDRYLVTVNAVVEDDRKSSPTRCGSSRCSATWSATRSSTAARRSSSRVRPHPDARPRWSPST